MSELYSICMGGNPSVSPIHHGYDQDTIFGLNEGHPDLAIPYLPEGVRPATYRRLNTVRIRNSIFNFRFADPTPAHTAASMAVVPDGTAHPAKLLISRASSISCSSAP